MLGIWRLTSGVNTMPSRQASRKKWKTSLKIDEENEPELLGEILVEEGVEDGVGDGARHPDHVGDCVHHDTQLCTQTQVAFTKYSISGSIRGPYTERIELWFEQFFVKEIRRVIEWLQD